METGIAATDDAVNAPYGKTERCCSLGSAGRVRAFSRTDRAADTLVPRLIEVQTCRRDLSPGRAAAAEGNDVDLAQRVTSWLIAHNASANAVSLSSIGFAGLAALCLAETRTAPVAGARALLCSQPSLFSFGFLRISSME
jgi:hypothetical protein